MDAALEMMCRIPGITISIPPLSVLGESTRLTRAAIDQLLTNDPPGDVADRHGVNVEDVKTVHKTLMTYVRDVAKYRRNVDNAKWSSEIQLMFARFNKGISHEDIGN